MTLRVALLSPPYKTSSTPASSMRPLGLIALHSYLAAEFRGSIELILFDFSDCAAGDLGLLDDLVGFDVVGMCAYSVNFPIVLEWGRELKRRAPSVKLVLGGPHATATAAHTAGSHRDVFDFVVRGEGERPMTAIIRSLLERQPPPRVPGVLWWDDAARAVVSTGSTDPVPHLDGVPVPLAPLVSPVPLNLEAYDRREGRMRRAFAFVSSRGCPFSCTFCSIRASDSKWRSVSARRLGEWIAAARAQDPGIEHINFVEADFLIDKKRVVAIGEMFASQHPGLTWSFAARVDDLARLGEPALAVLKTQGLIAVEVGLESGSQAMLDRLGKHVTVQQNYDAVAMLQRLDLVLLIDFILFVPDETPAQLTESVEFIKRAGLAEYLPHSMYFSCLIQYPGTPLRAFTEKLMGRTFSLDELPAPDDLFSHPGTRNIFRLFAREFAPHTVRLSQVIAEVDAAATRLSARQPKLAQRLRLESISLRHLPILMLEALIEHPGASTLAEAAPWFERLEEHLDAVVELCAHGDGTGAPAAAPQPEGQAG